MDENIKKTLDALEKNHMNPIYVKTAEDAVEQTLKLIERHDEIGMGGSMTLKQIGLIDRLKKERYDLLDWIYEDNDDEEKIKLMKKSLTADVFLTSTNALTMDGKLVNKDGRGNRLAALVYGPDKVIVVAGKNKIVKDTNAGLRRIEDYVAPTHTKRRGNDTPCARTLRCEDCDSDDRICRHTVITENQYRHKRRINVILIDAELGL